MSEDTMRITGKLDDQFIFDIGELPLPYKDGSVTICKTKAAGRVLILKYWRDKVYDNKEVT